jgi:cytosine deaminase
MEHAAGPTRMSRIETDKTILPYLSLSTEERAGNLIRECSHDALHLIHVKRPQTVGGIAYAADAERALRQLGWVR